MHSYTTTNIVAEFSKNDGLFSVEAIREYAPRESGPPKTIYRVIRRNLVDGEAVEGTELVVQDNLSTLEIIRYLAHCAEDGSILK